MTLFSKDSAGKCKLASRIAYFVATIATYVHLLLDSVIHFENCTDKKFNLVIEVRRDGYINSEQNYSNSSKSIVSIHVSLLLMYQINFSEIKGGM